MQKITKITRISNFKSKNRSHFRLAHLNNKLMKTKNKLFLRALNFKIFEYTKSWDPDPSFTKRIRRSGFISKWNGSTTLEKVWQCQPADFVEHPSATWNPVTFHSEYGLLTPASTPQSASASYLFSGIIPWKKLIKCSTIIAKSSITLQINTTLLILIKIISKNKGDKVVSHIRLEYCPRLDYYLKSKYCLK